MALQIRRGLAADLPASPADGELLYATDTNTLYVGDGGTAQEISGGAGGGLGNVVEDTTPQLGGDLDLNGYSIVSTASGDININPDGTGDIILHGDLRIDSFGNFSKDGQLNFRPTGITSIGSNASNIDGSLYITRNTYSSAFTQGFTFAQHHETADAVNFAFYRSRGTGDAPTTVLNGDDIVDIPFFAQHATGAVGAAQIAVIVDGTPSSSQVPAKISFATNNGTSQGIRAELSAAGIWKVNNLQNLSGTDLTLTATTVKVAGNFQLNAQGNLRFADSDSSNYVAFQAPTNITSNVTWTLPSTDGTPGQILSTDGAGTLVWNSNDVPGLTSRADLVPITTLSLADGESANVTFTGYKGYVLYKIQTDNAAWVRLYSSTAARTADSSRLEGDAPSPNSGVIAEVITTGDETILITPGLIGFSTELSPTTDIPCTVTNKSGVTTTITVTITALKIEI